MTLAILSFVAGIAARHYGPVDFEDDTEEIA